MSHASGLRRFLTASALAITAVQTATAALGETPPDTSPLPQGALIDGYVGADVMIPMRDGRRLHAEVWRPKDQSGALPILMQRSPYGYGLARVKSAFAGELKELAQEKFIFVLEDIRGRFGSEGDFVMLRPQAKSPAAVDESTDTFDSIDWLVKTLPGASGRVGVFGISYLGWTAAMATVHPHAALKAVSVQASPEDMFRGDDFHHNGAFRLDYGWEYAAALETNGRTMNAFDFGKEDPYAWFLKQKDLADLDQRALGRRLPTWRNFIEHPNEDSFWREQRTTNAMPAEPSVPDLIVAGWRDQEDLYGPLAIYAKQKSQDPERRNAIVIGPWRHGGWGRDPGDRYGPYPLGSETSVYFRAQVETPWFRYWLKGQGAKPEPGALVFETGSNVWRRYASWPPETGVVQKRLYLHKGGLLSFEVPAPGEGADGFVSDPAAPAPYRPQPISPVMAKDSTWPFWLADDQAPFSKRPDVLTWRSEPLPRDLTLRGSVIARLFASTTGDDADWIVKLVDLYPDDEATPAGLRGRGQMIADEVFRGRFRKSFARPEPLAPGKVLDYAVDLHGASHVFKAGHRIAVQVQSTWFPLIDRNPQTYVTNIFEAKPGDYKAQTHRVFHTPAYPSGLDVQVADDDGPKSR